MAKIFNNIFGTFSGKVGPVVFYHYNGYDCVRRRPVPSKHRLSPSELRQRTKFKMVSAFVTSIKELVAWSFRERTCYMTGSNYAMSRNMVQPLGGQFPDEWLDYSRMVISAGSLVNVNKACVRSTVKGRIDFSWKYHPDDHNAKPGDKCILVVHSPDRNKSIFSVGTFTRQQQKARIDVSEFREDREVHTWLSFISEDEKTVANSLYTGELLVL